MPFQPMTPKSAPSDRRRVRSNTSTSNQWTRHWSSRLGRHYLFDCRTGQSTWEEDRQEGTELAEQGLGREEPGSMRGSSSYRRLQSALHRAGVLFQQAPAREQSLARELVEELFYSRAALPPREHRSSHKEEVICLSDDEDEACVSSSMGVSSLSLPAFSSVTQPSDFLTKKIFIDVRGLGGEGRDPAGQHRVRVDLLEELGRFGLVSNLVIDFQKGFGVVSFGTSGAAKAAVVQGHVWVQGVLVEMKRYDGRH